MKFGKMNNSNILIKIIIIVFILFINNIYVYADNNYVKYQGIHIRGQYAYRQVVYNSVDGLNKDFINKIKLKNGEGISYFIVKEKYDCKKYRYKYYIAKLYTNHNRIVSVEKDNKWYYDKSKEEISEVCETCYNLHSLNKIFK